MSWFLLCVCEIFSVQTQELHKDVVEKLQAERNEAVDSLKEQYEIEISKTLHKGDQEAERVMEEHKIEIERQKSRYEEEKKVAEEDYCSKLEGHMAIIKEKDSMINALSEQLEQLEVSACRSPCV